MIYGDLGLSSFNLRKKIIRLLLKNIPEGDLEEYIFYNKYKISCIFVFFKRINLMKQALLCLENQRFEKDNFEVILVEDRKGSPEGRSLIHEFPKLNISYYSPVKGWGRMGYMRNYGLSKAQGEIILFLDDDTVIWDKLFLKKLYNLFKKDPDLMAVIPRGNPLFCLIKKHYFYHDPFFFTNRCMAYRRSCLIEMKGFDNNFIGQEDVEFAIRFIAKDYKFIKTNEIQYYHPPFIVESFNKAIAVGYSFSKSKYKRWIRLILGINGARWLPRIIGPTQKNIYMAKFSWGFMLGFIKGLLGIKPPLYVS